MLSPLVTILAIAGCAEEPAGPSSPGASETLQEAVEDRSVELIYVPAYTHALDQGGRVLLTTTLMVHNVSSRRITIHSVRYYDAAGALVESQIDEPRELRALETLELHQEPRSSIGGAGANFLVGWTSAVPGPAPLVEALMVGHQGAGRLTFTSRGVEIGLEEAAKTR